MVGLLVLVVGVMAGTVTAARAAVPWSAPPSGLEFTGEIPDLGALVAVHIDADGRKVTAYVSDGKDNGVAELFKGKLDHSQANLRAESHQAKLQLRLEAGTVTGALRLGDGQPVIFDAGSARGAEGLYVLRVTPDGTITGTSPAGGGFSGPVAEAELTFPYRVGTSTIDLSFVSAGTYRTVVNRYGLRGRKVRSRFGISEPDGSPFHDTDSSPVLNPDRPF